MSKKLDYMLWLVPEGGDFEITEGLIRQLSDALGTSKFIPHVTLGLLTGLSLEEIEHRVAALASCRGPIEFRLDRIVESDLFYKCVYVDFERSEEVLGFHKKFLEFFSNHVVVGLNRDPVDSFRPHLSLAYGNIDLNQRRATVQSLSKAQLPEVIRFNEISIVEVDGTPTGSQVLRQVAFG